MAYPITSPLYTPNAPLGGVRSYTVCNQDLPSYTITLPMPNGQKDFGWEKKYQSGCRASYRCFGPHGVKWWDHGWERDRNLDRQVLAHEAGLAPEVLGSATVLLVTPDGEVSTRYGLVTQHTPPLVLMDSLLEEDAEWCCKEEQAAIAALYEDLKHVMCDRVEECGQCSGTGKRNNVYNPETGLYDGTRSCWNCGGVGTHRVIPGDLHRGNVALHDGRMICIDLGFE